MRILLFKNTSSSLTRLSIITLLSLLLIFNVYSQETKLVVRHSTDLEEANELNKGRVHPIASVGINMGFSEEYYVLKSDEEVRHGTYVKYRNAIGGIQIVESGEYSNGQKTGVWRTFHRPNSKGTLNSIKEKGNYVNGKKNGVWTYYYLDTIPQEINEQRFGNKKKTDSINVSINQQSTKLKNVGMYLNDKRVGEWNSYTYAGDNYQKFNFSKKKLLLDKSIKDTLDYNTNRKALYVGGIICLTNLLAHEFKLSIDIMQRVKHDSTSIIVSFTITKDGNVINPKVEKSSGNRLAEDEAIRTIRVTDQNWIPALADSKTVDSNYKVQFSIIRISTRSHQAYRTIFEAVN